MIKLFLNTTDKFLCNSVKDIFEKTESCYKSKNINVDIVKELQNLEYDPIINDSERSSSFEKRVKFKIKMMLGIFFVAIPLFGFAFLSYMLSLEFTYAFVLTFFVAILATVRMDEIVMRYANIRYSKISY